MLQHLPLSTILLLPAALAAVLSKPEPLPLVIWHGLGDNYDADGLKSVGDLAKDVNPGTYVYNIRLDEDPGTDQRYTFFGNLTDQIAQVCSDLSSHPILSTAPAINALGFSQGGQFLRGYIERCNAPPVSSLVTFGSQHLGISKYQHCDDGDWLCRGWQALLNGNTWSGYAQSHLVPAQYFRSTDDATGEATDEYLENSNFLADVNNERESKNETYAKNIASLDRFVMYLFEDDTTVIPKESGWFAYTNSSSGEVTPLRNLTIYKEDWIGLKKLDEKGGLVFKKTEGGHMTLGDKVLTEVFETYFAPPKSVWEGVKDTIQEIIEL
ncbi:palmitoyl-protein thioesterase 1 precursor [Polyplosphaeria fusca]|uniref:Palmitoyl-protein thioesterase 1 n=1 Tax=Polyplosphaeria fusca TaxID=682080 RepID=A0A9P4R4C5_9PLEO|nr:palmitoyl-protein thioesterase 1 precursor [Polyplosphaeria fusca]